MPKETFFNLPEEKRKMITNIAMEEFAMHDYKTASLSRIVEKAGIAKGSMYQYFKNKKDLYLYIVQLASKEKLDYLAQALSSEKKNFFDKYKEMIFVAAKFDLSHPLHSRIFYNAGLEVNNKEIGDTASELLMTSDRFLQDFVRQAQQSGEIRTDLSADLIAFIISRLSVDIGTYVCNKFHFSYAKIITEGTGRLPITDEQLGSVLDDLVKFFKNGLQA